MGKIRVIRLKRKLSQSLGFAVRGGLEHGVGMYVSHVLSNSQADRKGLKVGDEILVVNGFAVKQAIHEDILNLIKAKKELVLKVRYVGMIPLRQDADGKLTWHLLESSNKTTSYLPGDVTMRSATPRPVEPKQVKIQVSVGPKEELGCRILSGHKDRPGIFVQAVNPGSLMDKAGLEVGDQIIDCNGVSFENISHFQAIVILKKNKRLIITVKKGAGNDFLTHSVRSKTGPSTFIRDHGRRWRTNNTLANTGHRSHSKDIFSSEEDIEMHEDPQNKYYILEEGTQEDLLQGAIEVIENIEEQNTSRRYPLTTFEHRTQTLPTNRKSVTSEFVREARVQTGSQTVLNMPYPNVRKVGVRVSMDKGVQTAELDQNLGTLDQPCPSFRLQKPVLLHPDIPRRSHIDIEEDMSSVATLPVRRTITEESFNPSRLFTNEEVAGRQIKLISITKEDETDMGVVLEERQTLEESGIFVAELYERGAFKRQGGIHAGDQLMMVDGVAVIDVSLSEANTTLKNSFLSSQPTMQLVVAKAPDGEVEGEILSSLPRPDYEKLTFNANGNEGNDDTSMLRRNTSDII